MLARPFAQLPPPADRRERQSRRQAGPAVLLYRALCEHLPRERALVVVGRVVRAGALGFLTRTLRGLDAGAFARLSPEQRVARVRRWLDGFFTTTAAIDAVGADSVSFTVTACALARLAVTAGHPELAPVFCRADAAFFASRRPAVALERPQTIAEGATTCPFTLTLSGER